MRGGERGSCRAVPGVADEVVALGVDFHLVSEEIAPYARRGGEIGDAAAEGLDRQPTVVAERLECRDRLADRRVAAAGRATVVLRDMDMAEIARSLQRMERGDR